MAKVHERILELHVECEDGPDTVEVTDVRYFRDRSYAEGHPLKHTAGSAAGTHEVEMAQILPPPTHIRIVSTFV